LIAHYAETIGLDALGLTPREWIAAMRGPAETDAAFLIRRLLALPAEPPLRELIQDRLDLPFVLAPDSNTPSRTAGRLRGARVFERRRPLDRTRPDLGAEVRRAPRSIRIAAPSEARKIVHLARALMVAMDRALDVFSYASVEDVRIADCGEGLQFAFIGFVPDRRLMLEALQGYLVLQNGVPIGYGSVAGLFESCEVAYNVFDPFRGGEASRILGRLLACARVLYGAETFSLDGYQLGDGNEEGLRSGAWWFYRKLGFAPRDAEALRLVAEEERRLRADRGHRSSRGVLRRLAAAGLYFGLERERDDVLGSIATGGIGLHVTRLLAERYGSEREHASRACAAEAARLLGAGPGAAWTRGERLAWLRWSPLALVLPGVARWSAAERKALAGVMRAKGGASEIEFVARFDRHRRLREAILALAAEEPTPRPE
jgi:hypothetical protein